MTDHASSCEITGTERIKRETLVRALRLMGEADVSRHRALIRSLLAQAIDESTAHPDLQIWLGLALEVNGELGAARRLYELAKQRYEEDVDDELAGDEARLNRAIAQYRLADANGLAESVAAFHYTSTTNYYVMFTWAYFLTLLGHFDRALECLDAQTPPLTLADDALALRGLILEGLERYDDAIVLLRELLERPINEAAEAEVRHVLAHTLIERRAEGDIAEGDYQMRRAAELNPDYALCHGIIHSETERFTQALTILDRAIADPRTRTQAYFRAEMRFYRGQAYWGLEDYVEARREFQHFEQTCVERGIVDGIVLARVYIAKCDLRSFGADKLDVDALTALRTKLSEFSPTPFASKPLKAEHARLIDVVSACLQIQHVLADTGDYLLPASRLVELQDRLAKAIIDRTQMRQFAIVHEGLPYVTSPSSVCREILVLPDGTLKTKTSDGWIEHRLPQEAFENVDIAVVDTRRGWSASLAYLTGAMSDGQRSIVFVTPRDSGAPVWLSGAATECADLSTAIAFAEIASMYEHIERSLATVHSYPGVVYYELSPSLSSSLSNPLPISLRKAIATGTCPDEWIAHSPS